MNNQIIRKAAFAGSWYDSSKELLTKSLKTWVSLTKTSLEQNQKLKAIVVPHAGYSYSGPTAAWSFSQINPDNYDRVFLLGPCHQLYLPGCGLTSCSSFETPLGNISIDTDIVNELSKEKNFDIVKKKDEEKEHSLEMQLPFLKMVFGDRDFKLIPIMVGNLNEKAEEYFGGVFKKYLEAERTLFVISSDFCHWGTNFDYQPYDKNDGDIFQSIEKLDKRGIDLIEKQNVELFQSYLKETENTICGRHPIAVFMFALKLSSLCKNFKTKLLSYNQSNQVKKKSDMSVSYASITPCTK